MHLTAYAEIRSFHAVRDLAPQLLPFVISAYGSPLCLFFRASLIEAREGVQQGDPLGPALLREGVQQSDPLGPALLPHY